AVNNGNVTKALSVLKNSSNQIAWENIPQPHDLSQVLEKKIISGYSDYFKTEDPATALECFKRFRILCVVKKGPFGVNAINRFAEKILRREGFIPPESSPVNPWYRGRPILITRNDYRLGLFNGDMGITLPVPGPEKSDMHVFFSGQSGELRQFSPHRLSEHESVYAMTVHKSQGSEFDHVLFLLPDRDYSVLTRELFYTGITRAIHKVSIWGTEKTITTTLSRKIERASGLRDALWG
ncbi:MAG: ATP-binding domain-containing protein, partial [Desulfobacterales bacterium]